MDADGELRRALENITGMQADRVVGAADLKDELSTKNYGWDRNTSDFSAAVACSTDAVDCSCSLGGSASSA